MALVQGYAVSAPVGSGDTNVRSHTGEPSGQARSLTLPSWACFCITGFLGSQLWARSGAQKDTLSSATD